MKVLDLRLTLFGVTFFLRFFCQYPGTFYYLMLAGSSPNLSLFSFTIKATRKTPIGVWEAVRKFFCFQRWKLKLGGV